MPHVRIEAITASVQKTTTGTVSVPPGYHALCINHKGAMMARLTSQGRFVLIPPRSLTYVRPSRWLVQVARGDHASVIISWPSPATSLLDHWLNSRHKDRAPRSIACKPIDPLFRSAVSRFEAAIAEPSETSEPLVVSFIFEVVPLLMTGIDQVQLAATPPSLPETILELTRAVRIKPNLPWPLRDAADRAGYSPFHFSRVFKSLVGYRLYHYLA
jgi:AraC-like DNA-binding protein